MPGRQAKTGRGAGGTLDRWRGLPAALVFVALVWLLDVVSQTHAVFIGFLALAPLIAAAVEGGRRTAVVSGVAMTVAVLAGLPSGLFGSLDHLLRVAVVFSVGLASIYVARSRTQREHRLRQVSEIAQVTQRAVLRVLPEQVGDLRVAARYLSAYETAKVGGDLYEVVVTPYGVRAIIGDACGKGLQAVLTASTALGAFRHAAYVHEDLAAVAVDLDLAVARDPAGGAAPVAFVTAALVQFGTTELEVVNCGHPAPVLRSGGDDLVTIEPPDRYPPLGLRRGAPPPTPVRHAWRPGDRLLLYTDGLLEARDRDGGFLALSEIYDCLAESTGDECVDRIVARLLAHTRGRTRDDAALMVLDRTPGPAR
ncbi:PP2C family protein-serine/threonine phosphatase [Polymorphospora sp. NPDC050346]|uniref:PP2C family protein-serine/threonine phosphatase n=1 Tax=Polymorphospora sp. NPDC050346 TaxID=3155780 RepID=UPI0033CD9640